MNSSIHLKTGDLSKKNSLSFPEEYFDVFQKSQIGIVIVNLTGRIQFCNEYICRITGLKKEEIIGKAFTQLTLAKSINKRKLIEVFRNAVTGVEVEPFVIDWKDSEGLRRSAEVTYAFIKKDTRISGIIGILKDNTLLKSLELEAVKSRDKLKNALEVTNTGIWELAFKSNMITYSARCWEMLGYSNEEFHEPLSGCEAIIHPDDKKNTLKMIDDCLADFSKSYNCEQRLICKDGYYKWFISSARVSVFKGSKPVLITGILLDISQRKDSEIALLSSERKYRDLFNTMGEGFALHEIIINNSGAAADYKFIDINKAFERLTGFKRKKILNRTVKEVMPDIEASWAEAFTKAALSGKPQSFENYSKYSGRFYNVYTYSPEKGKLASIFRDITEQKNNENNLKYLSFHDKLTGLYNRAYFEEELARLDTLRELPLSIIVGDVNSLKLINDAFGHTKGDILLKEITRILKNVCRAADMIARWGGDEFALLLPRTPHDTSEKIINRIQEKCKKINKFNVPVSISLGAATKERTDEDILKLLVLAEDNMYSNKLLDRKSISSSIITSLTQTLSEKSIETERHADRLKKLSLKVGRALKLPQKDLDKLALLALLHDIGKISLPDKIFSKSSRLSKSEWKEVKKHPETGYNICNSSPMITHLADEVLAHHERWDGSGYPQRISGKNIPLLSRIIFIIDAYDVMVKGRPYKMAITKKAAAEELKRCAGTQFDPNLVDAFIQVIS